MVVEYKETHGRIGYRSQIMAIEAVDGETDVRSMGW